MRTNRRGRAIFLWWVGACAVGGALAALDPTVLFLGIPVFSGGLLGAAQALVLRRCLPGIGTPWVAASFLGWVAGSLAQVFFPPRPVSRAPACSSSPCPGPSWGPPKP